MALFKGLRRGLGRGARRLGTAAHRGRLVREDLCRLVDLGALERFEARNLGERQVGEELQESADIAVVAVPPILPIVEMGQLVGVEPDRSGRRFSHFGTRCGREQRRREAIKLGSRSEEHTSELKSLMRSAYAVLCSKKKRIVALG